MPRKKAVAKQPNEDVERERYEKLLKESKDLQAITSLGLLAAICILAILVFNGYTITDQLNAKLDKLDAQQETIATHIALLEDNAVAQESPFCYGYDAYGQKGWGIDVSKINNQCEVS